MKEKVARKAPAETSVAKSAAVKKAPVTEAAAGTAPAKATTKEIREWAIGEGRKVSFRGRISALIVRAFQDAAAKLPLPLGRNGCGAAVERDRPTPVAAVCRLG
ncbi:histone-like nucleoid-structuring protein Lsr2 [Rhodococcus sp. NPDC019627]|uniref:Lsr2 family DNA-binding protein n=1 Tax=unclassified Rhodococcus (in: high G+C Gram-positive bacteria) TaxID=192944 RepID=UPI0033C98BEB